MVTSNMHDRVDLYSRDAEQQIIGVILRNPALFDQLPHQLAAQDFSPAHKRIFEVMSDIMTKTGDCDVVSLALALAAAGDDRLDYLTDLATQTVAHSNLNAYASVVIKKSIDREIALLGRELEALAQSQIDTDKKLEMISERCQALERTGGDEGEDLDSMLKATIDVIDQRCKTKVLPGLKTGFSDLDDKISGFQDSDLIIVAGRPSMGKTTLAMNFAANAVLAGGNVLVFSAESTRQSLMDRLISCVSKIPLSRIKRGDFLEEDWVKFEMAVRLLKGRNLTINDAAGIHVERLGAIARKRNRQKKINLIVVDYLQLLDATAESETHRVSKISTALKRIAKQTGAPVVAVAQLNRGVEGQANKRPSLKDLKQSGQIEQDADLIMMIYRDEYYNENTDQKGIAEIIIGKQRDGETGTVFLASKLECNRFDNLVIGERYAQTDTQQKRKGFY